MELKLWIQSRTITIHISPHQSVFLYYTAASLVVTAHHSSASCYTVDHSNLESLMNGNGVFVDSDDHTEQT